MTAVTGRGGAGVHQINRLDDQVLHGPKYGVEAPFLALFWEMGCQGGHGLRLHRNKGAVGPHDGQAEHGVLLVPWLVDQDIFAKPLYV